MTGNEEDTRRELTAQYRTLLETSTDGFYINLRGRFHYVNPALQQLLGAQSPDELLGREFLDFIHPSSHEAVRQRVQAIRQSTAPVVPLEEKYLRLDGSQVDVEVTAVAIVEGGEHAVLVTVRDISERKNAERARRSLEEQLRQSQKMEALGTLAGGIAHDFNNILSAVAGNAELARMRVAPDHVVQRYVEEILAATLRAKGLTRQVLAFSKQEPPRLDVLDLRRTVEDELSLLRTAAPVGITLDEALCSEPCPVLADATQIHQVLLNLCHNAWQSFEGRSGHIRVSLHCSAESTGDAPPADLVDGAHAVLSVEDDGPGIEERILGRIFDPFFTTKDPGAGTGLGLSVVHGIAKAHGGRIVCNSQVGRGTTFRLYLPLVEERQAVHTPGLPEVPEGRGERILYLDDEPVLVQVAKELLESHGYRVMGCASPAQALAALAAEPEAFDLLVTDLKMPQQTGLEVAQQAQTLAPALPVILISGYVDDAVRARAVALGIREVIHKPASSAFLRGAIARALSA